MRHGILFLLLPLSALFAETASAFPENVRHGYASCSTCHVSPTGGGVLTKYGRDASEDFLPTWTNKGENGALEGKVSLPDMLSLGGDVRTLSYSRDNKVYKEQGIIPMQADVEVAARPSPFFAAVVSLGAYDKNPQTQRHYLIANVGDHFYARVGRFFPAFGIQTPEHSTSTRRGLGFNESQERDTAEVGVTGELGEVVLDYILKNSGEISNEEKGFAARTAWYAGGKSQLGVSLLSTTSTVFNRTAFGAFAITGITKDVYVLAEVDSETKKPAEETDPTLEQTTRVVSYDKLGWEVTKGLHVLATYDMSVTTKGNYDPRYWSSGPGVQWFPRPHFEVLGQAQRRYDEAFSDKPGYLYTLMGHYYL